MKSNRIAATVLGCVGLAAYAAEPKVTSTDLDRARTYLQQTQDMVVGATKGLSSAQWSFKPAADRWSIAEIVEHMVLAQELILGPTREQLAKAPAPGERDNKQIDEFVLASMPDRTMKFQAPEIVQPTGRWTPAESMARLSKNCDELKRYLETTPDLRSHVVGAPALTALSKGVYESMDGYQAILLAAGHTERHVKQILEVRAVANFPSK